MTKKRVWVEPDRRSVGEAPLARVNKVGRDARMIVITRETRVTTFIYQYFKSDI